MRIVRLFIARDNEVIEITSLAAKVLNENIHADYGGLKHTGPGCSAGFDTVERLTTALYGKVYDRPSHCRLHHYYL